MRNVDAREHHHLGRSRVRKKSTTQSSSKSLPCELLHRGLVESQMSISFSSRWEIKHFCSGTIFIWIAVIFHTGHIFLLLIKTTESLIVLIFNTERTIQQDFKTRPFYGHVNHVSQYDYSLNARLLRTRFRIILNERSVSSKMTV